MTTKTMNNLLNAVSTVDTAALSSRLRGEVIVAGDVPYDEARVLHNRRFDRRPAVIVRAQDRGDIAEAIKFAREQGLGLAVRTGGHSVAGHSSIDGALVIDISALNSVSIDPATSTARVGAGARSGDLANAAHAYGLAVSTGDTATVGLGGLISGGGIGWMVRKHGLAIDNLLSAEIVTAEGEFLRANAKEHAELFWAIRGGGGNFGVITEFELKLWPDGAVLGGALVLPLSADVVRDYLDYAVSAPDELTTIGTLMHAPPAPFIPEPWVGKPVLMVEVAYAGSPERGRRAIQPLRDIARPVADTIAPMPYPVMFNYTAEAAKPAFASVKAMFARAISDATIERAIQQVANGTGPTSLVQLRPLGGAFARVSAAATAFAHRDKSFFVSVINSWQDPQDDAAVHEQWTSDTWEALSADADGTYANFLGDEGRCRVREAYPGATYARLALVKGKYDPTNVFRHNQNVTPASTRAERAA